MLKNGEGLGQFADLKGVGSAKNGVVVYMRGERGWYPNAHHELGSNFNCDFNLLMPMSSLLISNKKKYCLAIDWRLLMSSGDKSVSFIWTKEIFFRQSDRCRFLTKDELVYKNPLKRSVLKLQFQNPRNLVGKDRFFHTIYTKTTSNSRRNKN